MGVGSYRVCFVTYDELKQCLLSPESFYMFSNSEVDIAFIAALCNITVYTYTNIIQSNDMYGNRIPNRWTVTSPDPILVPMTYMLPGEIPDMVLYQEDECHYDLMTLENSRLAVQGTVPMKLQVMLPNPEVMDMEQQVV